jgi:hypothetical protein
MSKVLTSFASGKLYTNLLDIALPSFYNYSRLHEYDLFIPSHNKIIDICKAYDWDHDRPISWLKIPIIKYLLEKYDTVLWIDCDAIINKFDIDISNYLGSDCLQAFVTHHDKYEDRVPNMGVWLLNKQAHSFVNDIWNMNDYINHKWWEQGANIALMKSNLELYNKSCSLPYEFNVHKNDIRFHDQDWQKDGIILHATTWPNRLEKMQKWANKT